MVTDRTTKEKSKGDDEFNRLCEDTYEDLKKYVLWLTHGDKYAAEDIVQNTYEIAKKKQDIVLSTPIRQVGYRKRLKIYI
jgi:DNA-directed RNA polymerase specialized sigma24 family protein